MACNTHTGLRSFSQNLTISDGLGDGHVAWYPMTVMSTDVAVFHLPSPSSSGSGSGSNTKHEPTEAHHNGCQRLARAMDALSDARARAKERNRRRMQKKRYGHDAHVKPEPFDHLIPCVPSRLQVIFNGAYYECRESE